MRQCPLHRSGSRRVRRLVLVAALAALAAGRCAGGEAGGAGPDAVRFAISPEGFVMTWLGCGPFPSPPLGPANLLGHRQTRPGFERDWLKPLGGETKATPRAGTTVPLEGRPPRLWRPIAGKEEVGYVDLAAVFRPNENAVAYAACALRCARATRAVLKIGSSDGIKVWLNGRLVHVVRRARYWNMDEDTVAVRLNAGRNALFVKVDQLAGDWGFSVRLLDENKDPLRSVAVELPGQATRRDVVRLLAAAIVVEPKQPAVSERDSLVVRLGFDPTAPVTAHEITARGLVEDASGVVVAELGRIPVSGVHKRKPAFAPWRVSGLRDGSYQIRVELADRDGSRLATKRARIHSIHSYARRLAEANRAVRQAAAGLGDRQSVLAAVTLPSLERLIADARARWAEFENRDADWRFIQEQFEDAKAGARAMREGRDWFATHTGHAVKAYRCEHDKTLQPYSVYVPRAYDPNTSWPLVVSLHGVGENHWLNLRRLFGEGNRPGETDKQAKKFMPPLRDVPMLVACPNGRDVFGYEGLGEEDVWRVVGDVKRAYNVDDTRIYLTGDSMGGGGAWRLGLLYPDRFAAIAPVCGPSDYRYMPQTPKRLAPYQRTMFEAFSAINHAENALNLPVHVFQGIWDQVIPPANSSAMFRRLSDLGYRAAYTQYSAVGHNSWDDAYARGSIFDWFAQYRRDPCPRHVIYKNVVFQPSGAYWVRIDAPDKPRRFSTIEAAAKDNRLTVRVQNVRRFSLRLDRRLVNVDEPVSVTINGRMLPRVWVEEPKPIAFEIAADGQFWRAFKPFDPPLLPGLGLRPILDWHIYVYGASGTPRETALNRRVARRAADWGKSFDGRWPVMSDAEATTADLCSANAVLIGTPANNRLLARMADRLPIAVGRDSFRVGRSCYGGERAGLMMIYRNPLAPGRYVFIQSAFAAAGYANLRLNMPDAPPDYVLFDGRGKIARAGFFDFSWQFAK